jgi:hypothetical protein
MLTEGRSVSCSTSTKFPAAAMYSVDILIEQKSETASCCVVFFSAFTQRRDFRQNY